MNIYWILWEYLCSFKKILWPDPIIAHQNVVGVEFLAGILPLQFIYQYINVEHTCQNWIIGFSTLDSFKEVYFYAIVFINNLYLSSN